MRFKDKDDGEFRIHAGALELRAGQGFLAAVIVKRTGPRASGGGREVYRDTAVSGGHRWPTCDLALERALSLGVGAVAAERLRTALQPLPG